MKRTLVIIFIIVFISNLPPVKFLISWKDQMDYQYSNASGTFTFAEMNFKGNDYHMMRNRWNRFKQEGNTDTVLYRIVWNNPFKFWRWYDYLTLPKCKMPYISWQKIKSRRPPDVPIGRFRDF